MESLKSEPLAQTNKNTPGKKEHLQSKMRKALMSGISMGNSCSFLIHSPCCFPSILFLLQTTRQSSLLLRTIFECHFRKSSLQFGDSAGFSTMNFWLNFFKGNFGAFPNCTNRWSSTYFFRRSESPAPTSADLLSVQQKGGCTTNRSMLWHHPSATRVGS